MANVGSLVHIPFFHTFEPAHLRGIIPYFTELSLAPGEDIIKQGKINTKLYFLVNGTVSVLVSDKLIAEINTVGQVFGEMSLAINGPSTATVRAKEACTFLAFSFEDMRKSIDPAIKDGVLKNFYKGTMEILAAKLQSSNKRSQ